MNLRASQSGLSARAYRKQALIWLMTTLILGVVTALLWMLSNTPSLATHIENEPLTPTENLSQDMPQITHIDSLHELDTDVQPINFKTVVRDLRNYPIEFKDKRYLSANKGQWTLQVMNVSKNNIVTDYLNGRSDRDKFAYFRYLNNDDQPRYLLTYGVMDSKQAALNAAKSINFDLPSDVQVIAEQMSRYLAVVDDYERADPVQDMANQHARQVHLAPTHQQVPVKTRPQTSSRSVSSASRDTDSDNTATTSTDQPTRSIRSSNDTDQTLSLSENRVVTDEDAKHSASSEQAMRRLANGQQGQPNTASRDALPKTKPQSNKNTNTSKKQDNAKADKDNSTKSADNDKDQTKTLTNQQSQ